MRERALRKQHIVDVADPAAVSSAATGVMELMDKRRRDLGMISQDSRALRKAYVPHQTPPGVSIRITVTR